MKRSKRGKSRNNSPMSSARKQYQPVSVRGLVTSQQQSIRTSTQVSQYTQKTQRSNTFASSQEYQLVDDEIQKQEIREVFVSQEEEKVIHKILEVARKGKINQKNAFQIPLKVLDNENFATGKAKFWKFASQLLGASISIYQKRIENTWINTNLIHDKLARMTTNKNMGQQKENDQQQDLSQKRNQSEFMMLPLEQFRDPKILDNIKLGQQTLQVEAKINIPSLKKQFMDDPLFQKKLKTFDNTSLKGLLLNVFDLDSTCQVQLFCYENRLLPKNKNKMIENQYILPNQKSYLEKIIKQSQQNSKQKIFESISEFKLKNIVQDNKQQQAIDSIGFVRQENNKNEGELWGQLQQFLSQPLQTLHTQIPLQQQFFTHNPDSNQLRLINEDTNSQAIPITQQVNSQMSQKSLYSPISTNFDFPFTESSLDRSFHSVMTPWEVQFKQGRLRKKSTKKRGKREGKNKQKIQPGLVQFDAFHVQSKKSCLAVQKQKNISKSSKQSKSFNKKRQQKNNNLLPLQLAIYEKIAFKRVHVQRSTLMQNKQGNQDLQTKIHENIPDFLAPDPSMMYDNVQNQAKMDMQTEMEMFHPEALAYSNTKSQHPEAKKFNIRQTKKALYQQVKQERQLRVSQIYMPGLSPANLLITFLHIANQKNMIVRNTTEQDDIILSWQ